MDWLDFILTFIINYISISVVLFVLWFFKRAWKNDWKEQFENVGFKDFVVGVIRNIVILPVHALNCIWRGL